jgi:hypothetical protein
MNIFKQANSPLLVNCCLNSPDHALIVAIFVFTASLPASPFLLTLSTLKLFPYFG